MPTPPKCAIQWTMRPRKKDRHEKNEDEKTRTKRTRTKKRGRKNKDENAGTKKTRTKKKDEKIRTKK